MARYGRVGAKLPENGSIYQIKWPFRPFLPNKSRVAMTTVAWDGRMLAADRRMAGWQDTCKLFKLKDGRVLAGAGYMDELHEVAAWLNSGSKPASKPATAEGSDSTDYLLMDGAKLFWLTCPYLRPVEVLDGMAAVGSGAQYALGAMQAGKSAAEAVEIAARFDHRTGGGVDIHLATTNDKRRKPAVKSPRKAK